MTDQIPTRTQHGHAAINDQINEKIVGALPTPATGNRRHYFSGVQLQGKKAPGGFGVRVTCAGTKSFIWLHRVDGKEHIETIGQWRGNPSGGDLAVLDAITKCAERAKAVAKGVDRKGQDVDPLPARTRSAKEISKPAAKTIAGLLDSFVERYVEKDAKLRSAGLIKQTLDRLVKPRIGDVGIYDLKRSQVSKMLDEIADENGEVMADRTLAYCRKAFNWLEVRDDDFKSPIVRGMQRTKASEHARDRILTDDEIRALWKATEGSTEPFEPMLRFILLTACRRMEAAAMPRSEVVDGVWTIPASRSKNKVETVLPLSQAARDILASMPTVKGVDYVFSRRTRPLGGFSQLKTKIDERCGFDDWTIHDLRRTARSLMSRAGVPTDHAERALGHLMPGVRGVYDRYAYLDEKRAAFDALARMIAVILDPPASNIVPLRKA